jgi:AraC family transcriptional regulator
VPVESLIPMKTLKLSAATPHDVMYQGCRGDVVHLVAPVTVGETRLSVNGRVLHEGTIWPGMLRLSNPEDVEDRLIRKPFEAMIFSLPPERVRRLMEGMTIRPNSLRYVLAHPELTDHRLVRQLVGSVKLARTLPAEPKAIFIDGVAEALLAVFLGQHQRSSSGALKSHPRKLSDRQLRECMFFAEQRLGSGISVTEWAEVLHLSTSEFGRRFQRSTGLTPYAWFMHRRIGRAKELLRKRSTLMCELALKLGFASQSHFTETFRQHTGVSPARWRKLRLDFDTSAVS